MKARKNISVLSIIAIIAMSIVMPSFYSPKEQEKEQEITLAALFELAEIPDSTVSDTDQIVYFKSFTEAGIATLHLILSGTYGTIVLSPEIVDSETVFIIPSSFNKHAGLITYQLMLNKIATQKGTFRLLPNTTKIGAIETYLGPRSIIANERDYTMLVSIPTDALDNMLPDSTKISLKNQFKSTITNTTHHLASGFAWKRIFSPLKKGRLSTASTLGNESSKELIADVFPDVARVFSILAERNHNYADGNEIITFKTSQIKDDHDNIMTDGTLVTFTMIDNKGAFWQTNASTVNGFAFAKMLHPQTPCSWQIIAAIKGIAQSPEITQKFNAIIDSIPVIFQKKEKLLLGHLQVIWDN